jgi:hypothetical protein
LSLPFLTRISDSDQYILAAEQGTGIYEMNEADVVAEREEFQPVINWLDSDAGRRMTPQNVVHFERLRIGV